MFINTSSIIPSICATYLSNITSDNSNTNTISNISSNNDAKFISENCLCYNGRLLYIIVEDDFRFYRMDFRFSTFDDFILDLFEYCFENSGDDYEKELHNMLCCLFENRILKFNDTKYRLLII